MTLNEYIETEKETEGYESDQEMMITLSNLSSIVEKFKLEKKRCKILEEVYERISNLRTTTIEPERSFSIAGIFSLL